MAAPASRLPPSRHLPDGVEAASLTVANGRYRAGTYTERGVYTLAAADTQWQARSDGVRSWRAHRARLRRTRFATLRGNRRLYRSLDAVRQTTARST
jgi:hypothetical protein